MPTVGDYPLSEEEEEEDDDSNDGSSVPEEQGVGGGVPALLLGQEDAHGNESESVAEVKEPERKKHKGGDSISIPKRDRSITTHNGVRYSKRKDKIFFPVHLVSCAHDVFICLYCEATLSPSALTKHFAGAPGGGGCAQGEAAQAILAPAFKAVRISRSRSRSRSFD
jgi:hypothetical protein